MGTTKVQGETIDQVVTVYCGRFADPEAIVREVWMRTGCDVTIVEAFGSWMGVVERSLTVTFFGDEYGVADVVQAMHDVAARHDETAILVDRRSSEATLELSERVDWEAVYGTVGEVA